MEEFKKKGYYPAGGRSQTSSAGSITYINTNSGLPAGNVQDAIDEVAEKVNKGEIYSTDEVVIGTWIDGKPLYRKVVGFVGDGSTLQYVPSTDFDMSANIIRNMSAYYYYTASPEKFVLLPKTDSVQTIGVGSNGTGIFAQTSVGVLTTTYTFVFIVEYTKIND